MQRQILFTFILCDKESPIKSTTGHESETNKFSPHHYILFGRSLRSSVWYIYSFSTFELFSFHIFLIFHMQLWSQSHRPNNIKWRVDIMKSLIRLCYYLLLHTYTAIFGMVYRCIDLSVSLVFKPANKKTKSWATDMQQMFHLNSQIWRIYRPIWIASLMNIWCERRQRVPCTYGIRNTYEIWLETNEQNSKIAYQSEETVILRSIHRTPSFLKETPGMYRIGNHGDEC